MRAALLHGIRDLRLQELPRPAPGPGQVLLRIAAVGVCGSDVHYYLKGRIGDQAMQRPFTLGHEFSAQVAGLGADVSGLAVGQWVAVEPAISCGQCEACQQGHPNLCPNVRFCGAPPIDGAFAEYMVMPAPNCFPLPQEIDAIAGALLEPLGIALHSIDLAQLKPGQTVAVLGAGPIGLLTAAVARAAAASAIYVSEPLSCRRQFALRYAADAVMNPTETDIAAEIARLTGGRGVDVAFEAAGVSSTPDQAAAVTRPGGRVILIGIPPDDQLTLSASIARRKGLTIKMVRRMKHTYPRAIRLVQHGAIEIRPLATHTFSLARITEAFETAAAYRDGVLRAIVQPAP